MVALTIAPASIRSSPRGRYQAQDSEQTLAEGLAEYYARNHGRVSLPSALPPQSAELFRRHDLCHVIFGLDTTLSDEAMADMRTLFSCDVGWRRYAKYLTSDPQAKAIFKELGYLEATWVTLKSVSRFVRAMVEAWRTPRRWPWSPPSDYMHRSLSDLRREFGIRVI